MKPRIYRITVLLVFVCTLILAAGIASAQKKVPDTVTLKLEKASLPPVMFSHITHTQKTKINCIVCHHKDSDPKEAQACRMCHQGPEAKDVFHKKCQTCHKESTAKGVKAPTQCTECHKK